MSIRSKIILITVLAFVLSVLANFALLQKLLSPTFARLEEEAARVEFERVRSAMDRDLKALSTLLWDYSTWDDAYYFGIGKYKRFPEENFAASNLKKFNVDVVELFNMRGELLFGGMFTQGEAYPVVTDWNFAKLDPDRFLFVGEDATSDTEIAGMIATPAGPLLFSARPILRHTAKSPPSGTFFFGRLINEAYIKNLSDRTRVNLRIMPLADLDPAQRARLEAAKPNGSQVIVEPVSDKHMVVVGLLRDFRGQPILAMQTFSDRAISEIGARTLVLSAIGVASIGLLVLVFAGLILQVALVSPLIRLTEQIVAVGSDASFGRSVALKRNDEIGVLSREFERMLGRLAEARVKLLEQSYAAGLAEMASGVLHNVRNQLSPLALRVGRLREQMIQPVGSKLGEVAVELGAGTAEPQRRAKLEHYLHASVRELERRRSTLNEQLSALSGDVDQIDQSLRDLDKFSHFSTQLEAVDLAEVIEKIIDTLPRFPDTRVEIEIDPRVREQPQVLSNSFIVKHILQNLFTNAVEAIAATGRGHGRVHVSAETEWLEGRPFLHTRVADDGIGIDPEHVTQIFTRGFSTKRGERRGTGLHWCANSVSALGGKLFASSPGSGQGATLHLLFLAIVENGRSA